MISLEIRKESDRLHCIWLYQLYHGGYCLMELFVFRFGIFSWVSGSLLFVFLLFPASLLLGFSASLLSLFFSPSQA